MSAGSVAAVFGASFAVSLSSAASAWPMPQIISREARSHGILGALAIIAGHVLPEALLLVALALTFDQLIDSQELENALFITGGLVLIWTGIWTAALSLGRGSPFSHAYPDGRDAFRSVESGKAAALVVGGLALTLSSLEWFALWFTARAALIAHAVNDGAGTLLGFATGHWLADVGWLLLVASSVALGERLIDSDSFRIVIAVCGVAMVGLGAGFMYQGLSDIS